MLTSAAIIAGMCAGSICLASLVARAADNVAPGAHSGSVYDITSGNGGGTRSPAQAQKQLEVESWQLGNGSAAARKAKVRTQDIHFTKKYDKASPVLAAPAPGPQAGDGAHALYQDVVVPTGGAAGPAAFPGFQGGVTVASGDVNAPPPAGGSGFTTPTPRSASQFDALVNVPGINGETESTRGPGIAIPDGTSNKDAAGVKGGASVAGIIDGTSNTLMVGERTIRPGAPAVGALTSLSGVASVGSLERFANSHGGDQHIGMLLPAVQAAREAARRDGSGGPGCTVGCQNNLSNGKLPGASSLPTEQLSMNYGKVQPGLVPQGGTVPTGTVVFRVDSIQPAAGGAGGASAGPGAGPHVKVFDGGSVNKPGGAVVAPGAIRAK